MTTRVVLVSGHLTDEPHRGQPARFPETAEAVEAVQRQISEVLARWGVGPGWIVVLGGARGADLLAAEVALERGAGVHLCLAFEPEIFVDRSVRTPAPHPARDWPAIFARVRSRALTEVLSSAESVDPATPDSPRPTDFARANDWMLDELRQADQGRALLVWDGNDGYTGTLAARVDEVLGPASSIEIIDPTPRAYLVRQGGPGPKKILSLDGGGLRGVISLEVLAAVERQLRQRTGKPDLVLADYFDYLAGTSTGAIIATALSLGRSVAQIRERYHQLGHAAFRPTLRALTEGARYGAGAVREQLVDFFDADLVLGDPRLRTLLLLVMHRVDTDSAWLLSNCTGSKYNRTDRLLPRNRHDRNLDLPLLRLIRASTAAPTFFAPETISIGGKPVVFQDGGVTAFNNPALIAAVMATLPAYGLQWNKGTDDLLVVSVGTGARAAVAPPSWLPLVAAVTGLGRLPSVLMNGSAFSQDLLCRVIGDCRYGPTIDSEVGDLIGRQFEPDDIDPTATTHEQREDLGIPMIGEYFSYVRYDADLSDAALSAGGIDRRHHKRIRRMDLPGQIPSWQRLGERAAAQVDVDQHFRGFLPPAS